MLRTSKTPRFPLIPPLRNTIIGVSKVALHQRRKKAYQKVDGKSRKPWLRQSQPKLHTSTTPKYNLPQAETPAKPHSPERELLFTPPSKSTRPNQKAGSLLGLLTSPTLKRLVQPNLESLSNSLLKRLSKT